MDLKDSKIIKIYEFSYAKSLIVEEEDDHWDCTTCDAKYEIFFEEIEKRGFLTNRYKFKRLVMRFMDDHLLENLRKLVRVINAMFLIKILNFTAKNRIFKNLQVF